MAHPTTIQNGDIPDASKLMAWFDWLAAGRGITAATYAELQETAAASPAEPFDCWATDKKLRLFYCGDATQGDEGFFVLAGGGAIDKEDN